MIKRIKSGKLGNRKIKSERGDVLGDVIVELEYSPALPQPNHRTWTDRHAQPPGRQRSFTAEVVATVGQRIVPERHGRTSDRSCTAHPDRGRNLLTLLLAGPLSGVPEVSRLRVTSAGVEWEEQPAAEVQGSPVVWNLGPGVQEDPHTEVSRLHSSLGGSPRLHP